MHCNLRQEHAERIFRTALASADPRRAVQQHHHKISDILQQGRYRSLLVAGFGKAACAMAAAMEEQFGDSIERGVIITPYGYCPEKHAFQKIRLYEGGHPIPDENGQAGTAEIIRLLKGSDEHSCIVCLISGGGSSLLVSPYKGVSLAEKKQVTALLLNAGAAINELNTVRKHLSSVKGGRLAKIAHPGRVVSLILSDVVGDKLDVIASGPTAPDDSTFGDAVQVIEKHKLSSAMPAAVIDFLAKGSQGMIPETPKRGDAIFGNVENSIIAGNRIALEAARAEGEKLGYPAEIITSELTGEAREAGRWLAHRAMGMKRSACLVSGGETTVMVTGTGAGGRNLELALAFAMEIQGLPGITLLSAGTDGRDGSADAAGAVVDGGTIAGARARGLDPAEYLANNDSYAFFRQAGGLVITGPTGTNVMDIQVIIVDRSE
jgi:hydroxypyruvate reductase/glycerate 2-kinase